MKKKIIFVFVLLLLTGCSANYNLTIDEKGYAEKLTVNGVDTSELGKLMIPLDYEVDEYFGDGSSSDSVYDVKVGEDSFSLSHRFNYSDFLRSTLLNACYDQVDVKRNGKNIYISTVGDFNCFDSYDVDSVKVSITSKYKFVDSNCDSVNDNTYVWNIDRYNISKGIYIEFVVPEKKGFNINSKEGLYVFLIFTALILLLGVIMLSIKKMNDSDEKV
jgi:hypothetical protein